MTQKTLMFPADLHAAFSEMKGLSSRSLQYMRLFAETCKERQLVQQSAALIRQQSAAQLPWFHIMTLLTQVRSFAAAPVSWLPGWSGKEGEV